MNKSFGKLILLLLVLIGTKRVYSQQLNSQSLDTFNNVKIKYVIDRIFDNASMEDSTSFKWKPNYGESLLFGSSFDSACRIVSSASQELRSLAADPKASLSHLTKSARPSMIRAATTTFNFSSLVVPARG